jgi:DNA-binding MarR family transcriptional regulator/RimJ/RimL family protein N-acetyltransferase
VSPDRVQQVRAFTRFWTKVTGVLGEDYLHTPWTVTEARLLYELATGGETTVADLRKRLDLDRGYLSRVLASFEERELVARERDEDDARLQRVRLTPAGRREFQVLNRRSASNIRSLLRAHPEQEQAALLQSMATIRRVLHDEVAGEVELGPPRPGDHGWVVARHGALYAAEYGWDTGFEALVAEIVAAFLKQHDPAYEAAWVARVGDEPLGCVYCVRKDARTAQLRLLLVEPTARGLGVGTALVDACIDFARDCGYERLVLWTNDVLTAARRIYERAGFRLEEEERHHSFGADLVGQYWGLPL